MANYSLEEERELNTELKYFQNKLGKYINSDKWDTIGEQLSNTIISQISMINSAETHKDISWLVWNNMEYITNLVGDMYNKPSCFNGRLQSKYCYGQTKKDGYLYKKCLDCKWCNYNR